MVNALAVWLRSPVIFQHPMASQGSVSCSHYGPKATEALSAPEPISGMQLYLFCGLQGRIPHRLGEESIWNGKPAFPFLPELYPG